MWCAGCLFCVPSLVLRYNWVYWRLRLFIIILRVVTIEQLTSISPLLWRNILPEVNRVVDSG